MVRLDADVAAAFSTEEAVNESFRLTQPTSELFRQNLLLRRRNSMRRDARFHILVFCMAMLTFSLPFATLAQQNSVRVKAKTAEAQDANVIRSEAKVAAEQHASRDINKLLWFSAGVGVAIVGSTIGAGIGCVVGSSINPGTYTEGFFFPDYAPSEAQCIGPFIGMAIGGLAPLIGIYGYQGNPPPERLVGKSPEYVVFYTDAYKAKTRSIRTKWAAGGGLIGVGVGIGCLSILTSDF